MCAIRTLQSSHSPSLKSLLSEDWSSGQIQQACPGEEDRMKSDDNHATDDEATEGGEQELDFWSDEGARRFNEALDEGSAYAATCGHLAEDFEEAYLEDEETEYVDPELYDPDEETLPPGEMELIFENSFIM